MSDPFVQSFDSLEEMFQYMARNEMIANARATQAQKAITYGDYWHRYDRNFRVHIYGYVIPLLEMEADERSLGADDAEWDYERRMTEDAHSRGYRFSRAFSVIEPEGELGLVHIVAIDEKITEAEFQAAKDRAWQPE